MSGYTAQRLQRLLTKLSLTPAEFADAYELNHKLVLKWLTASAHICDATAMLLEAIEQKPDITRKR